jgi:hypothetical protein
MSKTTKIQGLIVYIGDYSDTLQCRKGNLVSQDNKVFIALQGTPDAPFTGQAPPTTSDSNAYWKLIMQGVNGVTPLLRINTTTKMWEISVDGGTTYTSMNVKAEGADGVSEFDGVQTVTGTDVTQELQPNILYTFGEVTSLSLTLATPTNTARVNEYMFQFTSGTTATTLTLPSTVKWIGSNYISANKTYQISIVNNLAALGGA